MGYCSVIVYGSTCVSTVLSTCVGLPTTSSPTNGKLNGKPYTCGYRCGQPYSWPINNGFAWGVSIHWTGLLDWNTGLDYWTEVFSFFGQDSVVFGLLQILMTSAWRPQIKL